MTCSLVDRLIGLFRNGLFVGSEDCIVIIYSLFHQLAES